MGLFSRPKDESELFEIVKLKETEFAKVKEYKAIEHTHKFHVIVDETNYNLVYRDGQFLGMPLRFGGKIYPFSKNLTKQGSWLQMRKFTSTRIITVSKGNKLLVEWGSSDPYMIEDPVTREPYKIYAGGKFYVGIIRNNLGETANKFYLECLSQGRLADQVSICNYLKPAFETYFGAKIQEYIQKKNKSLDNYVGLGPDDLLAISKELFETVKNIFESFGLEMVAESDGALLKKLSVLPA